VDQLALDVVVRGWTKSALRDEIFMQLCKQTTDNYRPLVATPSICYTFEYSAETAHVVAGSCWLSAVHSSRRHRHCSRISKGILHDTVSVCV
jgi:hypothetical protein